MEWMEVLRFVMLTLTMTLAIWMFMYLIQHPQCVREECVIAWANGTSERTGLYGNCTYILKYTTPINWMDDDQWMKV